MRASEEQLRIWMIGGLDGDAEAHAALLRALVPMLDPFSGVAFAVPKMMSRTSCRKL